MPFHANWMLFCTVSKTSPCSADQRKACFCSCSALTCNHLSKLDCYQVGDLTSARLGKCDSDTSQSFSLGRVRHSMYQHRCQLFVGHVSPDAASSNCLKRDVSACVHHCATPSCIPSSSRSKSISGYRRRLALMISLCLVDVLHSLSLIVVFHHLVIVLILCIARVTIHTLQ